MLFVVGSAFVGVGGIIGGIWLNDNNGILPHCPRDECPIQYGEKINDAKLHGQIALTSLLVGGAAIGAGVVLTLREPEAPKDTKHASGATKLVVGPGSIALRGAF